MDVFEIVILLLLAGAGLAAFARKIATPYPALVAMAGAGLALIPRVPTLVLDPELALALFVAPVLLDAAFDASQRDLRKNWRPITSLALGAVALTVVVVAFVAHWLVPAIPWAAAIALGAIVAPPDAAAATAVLKQLKPPHRLLVILEGESLFNDASALLIYRIAVGTTAAGAILGWRILPMLLLVTIGSVILGLALSPVIMFVNGKVEDVATAVILQFCGTFAVWMIAERLHLSGILTVVVFAMAVSRRSGEITPARIRIPSYAVWEVAVFVLNVLAFLLVGFQLRLILQRLDRPTLVHYGWLAGAVCIATILARILWVTAAAAFSRRRKDSVDLDARAAAVVGWCGMRGTVTLAAALALPAAFPSRDLILFVSFAVVLGTLVVQGMSLRPLLSILKLEDDGEVEHEVRLARVETLRAALGATEDCPGAETAQLVRRRYELLLHRAQVELDGSDEEHGDDHDGVWRELENDAEVIRFAAEAERKKLNQLRADGTIGDAAFQVIEQELDLEELDRQQLVRTSS
ncbi:MAG: Na+/H+ antiporter [Acidobacteria bacterium]|nr:Na+/H+ antiporter [Acidobacteriota bacterium]